MRMSRSCSMVVSGILYLLVFGRQQVEPQPVVCAAVDVMALPLPADRPEVDALRDVNGRIVLDDPGMNRVEAEFHESERQHLRGGAARVTLAGEGSLTKDHPD